MYDRSSSFWDRCMVFGVKPKHFLIAHLIECFLIVVIQFVEVAIYSIFFLLDTTSFISNVLILTMFLATGIFGLSFGAFIAVVFDSTIVALSLCSGFSFYLFYVSGIAWPVEGMPRSMQPFAYPFTFVLPMNALRNLENKNASIDDVQVQGAFLLLIGWASLFLFCSFKLVAKNKALK
jgi:ABC-type polysaccharide/polyol phosphate export permease